MGREIKRVALDFDYPINQMIWKGYHSPYNGLECKPCQGTGESPEFKELSDAWYGFDDESKRWCNDITQDEVQALFDAGRLRDFDGLPTAKEVNEWNKNTPFGHDAINKWICVKARAKRIGITETECSCCKGKGQLWPDEKFEQLAEDFEWIDPPAGDGYQLWSTTTEGTPMSPVFAKPEDLAVWLVENNASTFAYQTTTYENWMKFICGSGWSPTMIMHEGVLQSGVDAVASK